MGEWEIYTETGILEPRLSCFKFMDVLILSVNPIFTFSLTRSLPQSPGWGGGKDDEVASLEKRRKLVRCELGLLWTSITAIICCFVHGIVKVKIRGTPLFIET